MAQMSTVTKTNFNTRARTWILIAGLSGLLVGIGFLIGGGGIYLFVAIAVIMNLVGYWFSDKIAIKASKAQPVPDGQLPEVRAMVSELSQLFDVPEPRLFLIPSEQPNAFATGRNPSHAAVAVTQGLLRHMPTDQVRGVMAHEFAHIKNRDILVSSIAAMIAAAIAWIANILQFSLLFGGGNRDNPLGIIGMLATIIIAPLAAMILQMAVSRQREYLADASAARRLGEGRSLADALGTLKRGTEAIPLEVNPATASLYIANPMAAFRGKGLTAMFSTHPPIDERISRLETIDQELTGVRRYTFE
ncbi:MAG: M48 family metalloprotease [Gaiellaceae bacterium]